MNANLNDANKWIECDDDGDGDDGITLADSNNKRPLSERTDTPVRFG